MPVAQYPSRWWNFYLSKDEREKRKNQFLMRSVKSAFSARQQYTIWEYWDILVHENQITVQKYL